MKHDIHLSDDNPKSRRAAELWHGLVTAYMLNDGHATWISEVTRVADEANTDPELSAALFAHAARLTRLLLEGWAAGQGTTVVALWPAVIATIHEHASYL